MKTSLRATVAISLLIGSLILMSASVALTQTAPPATLRQRVVWPKPGKTILNRAKDKADVIVVKFREGTHVRERAGQLEADLTNLSESEERLLQRADLPRQRLFQDLAQVNGLIGLNSKRFVRRLFTRPENELDVDKRTGEARVGEELADLNLYYLILVADAKLHETERLIDQLNALDIVEIAYPQPVLAAAETDVAQSASPAGFFPEARDVQVIDIGHSANLTQKGSAVPGQTCVVGPCVWTGDIEDAVSQATAALRAGDVMLIRQYAPGPYSGLTATCNVNQFESIAMEFWDANFDAIKHATAKGIVVIEAAGIGSMNLDSPVYNRKFDRSVRDSGAIVAGAGLADARLPQCTANIGSRVDIPEATRSQPRSESAMGAKLSRLPPGGDDPDPDPPISAPPACLNQAKTSLTATPPTIELGGRTTLQWSVQLPTTCPPGLDQWLQLNGVPVALVGSQSVQPLTSTTFFLTMPFPRGTAKLGTTTVTVNLPKVVDIKGSTRDWATLMATALAIPGETVRLAPDVDMDLSGAQDIVIAEGVNFLGGICTAKTSSTALTPFETCGAHDAHHLGPRLFTNTRPKHLFLVTGDNVRIEGFRLHGRDFGTVTCHDCDIPYGIAIFGNRGIAIANMELAGWSGGAISVNEEKLPDRLTRDNARFDTPVNLTVWIHDNFFHHNLHHGQYGYGVDLAHGAYARIESNVFDFNRHAITSGGDAGTGYFARRNLILKGTTQEGACAWNLNLCVTTQEFDVHGTDDCNGSEYSCGQAGEYFEMTENAFQYAVGYSIKVRGNPTIGALVASNVFANSEGDAIAQNGNGDFIVPIQRRANVFGVDTYGKYGVCDFDGDGIDDLFLATGVSWWYMSGARMQWVYLNSSTERLEQIGLGDFDGDHRCDVFSVHADDFGIYPGGSLAWKSLGTYGVPFSELRFGDFNGDGIMDIFRRAPDSQWWIISPGHYGWTPVQSSPKPLSELRFGDFNNDHITDVISLQSGGWAVSWGGRTVWQPLNSLTSSLQSVLIADIDHNGKDDILRYRFRDFQHGIWEVSWDGRSDWTTLQELTFPPPPFDGANSAPNVFGLVGRFRNAGRADLVSVDYTRMGRVYDIGSRQFLPHSLYAY